MGRLAYVNGRYFPQGQASVHIEDRGYQFADGVYEVVAVYDGRLIDADGHIARLGYSLRELRIDWPVAPRVLPMLLREMVRRNRMREGTVYLQVTRGVAPRDHAFPAMTRPSLVITTKMKNIADLLDGSPIRVITAPDIRWGRPDIKSVALLPNCLAKQQAREAGVFETWMVDRDGFVTEGTSSNAWIVTAAGEVRTRAADRAILNGITRQEVLKLIHAEGLGFVERPFSVDEAFEAREAFLTSTSSFVKPVVAIDGRQVADGVPGPLSRRLGALFRERVLSGAALS